MPERTAVVERKTSETEVKITVNLDSPGGVGIATGIGFFDHMLEQVARHGRIGLTIESRGDLHVDKHHTVEDVGLAFGEALAKALGDKAGIERYGHARIPMMESLADVTLDFCGRPFTDFRCGLAGKIGEFDAELIEEFFRSVATKAGMTLHMELVRAGNRHHGAEALFKAFAVAVRRASARTGHGIPSTKGSL